MHGDFPAVHLAITETGPSLDPALSGSPSPDATAIMALSDVLRTPEKRRALFELVNDDAQVMVDFLQSVSSAIKLGSAIHTLETY